MSVATVLLSFHHLHNVFSLLLWLSNHDYDVIEFTTRAFIWSICSFFKAGLVTCAIFWQRWICRSATHDRYCSSRRDRFPCHCTLVRYEVTKAPIVLCVQPRSANTCVSFDVRLCLYHTRGFWGETDVRYNHLTSIFHLLAFALWEHPTHPWSRPPTR